MKILKIVSLQDAPSYPPRLVSVTCSLLAAVVSELSAAATGSEASTSSQLQGTPNRFGITSRNAQWNTSNGSPDAVCFSVDRAGVLIAGVGLYGGAGDYEFEIEFMDEV